MAKVLANWDGALNRARCMVQTRVPHALEFATLYWRQHQPRTALAWLAFAGLALVMLALGGGLLVVLSSAVVCLSWLVLMLSALGLVGYTGATIVFGSMTLFFSATTAVAGVAVLSASAWLYAAFWAFGSARHTLLHWYAALHKALLSHSQQQAVAAPRIAPLPSMDMAPLPQKQAPTTHDPKLSYTKVTMSDDGDMRVEDVSPSNSSSSSPNLGVAGIKPGFDAAGATTPAPAIPTATAAAPPTICPAAPVPSPQQAPFPASSAAPALFSAGRSDTHNSSSNCPASPFIPSRRTQQRAAGAGGKGGGGKSGGAVSNGASFPNSDANGSTATHGAALLDNNGHVLAVGFPAEAPTMPKVVTRV